jgi:hypothetical protein
MSGASQRALALALDDVSLHIRMPRLGMVWQRTGDYRQAVEFLRRAVQAFKAIGGTIGWKPAPCYPSSRWRRQALQTSGFIA